MKQLLVIAALAIVIATVAGCHKPKEEDVEYERLEQSD